MKLTELFPENEFKEIISFAGSELSGETEIKTLTSDSRKAGKDSIFVCINGSEADGHEYVPNAYKLGCRIFVCEHAVTIPGESALVIAVPDTRKTLALLAERFYGSPAKKLKLIGITGTKGKSTVAEFIYRILNDSGRKAGIIGTCGIRFGVEKRITGNTTPDALELASVFSEMYRAGIEYVVMEVSSQACLLDRIYGLHFERAVFTNLYYDHIGPSEHPTFENYKECKKSLFRMADISVINSDDHYARDMISGIASENLLFFGCASEGSRTAPYYRAENIARWNEKGIYGMTFDCRDVRFYIRMPGTINVSNAMAAISVCESLGLSLVEISERLRNVTVRGRFETYESDGRTFVIDYAHNGASLESALKILRAYTSGRLIVLFGSVGGRTQLRRSEMGEAADRLADFCIVTSDNPDAESPEDIIDDIVLNIKHCPHIGIPDRADAIRYAVENAKPGDVVLLAGKGHEEYQLIDGKKISFSERDILKKALEEMYSLVL